MSDSRTNRKPHLSHLSLCKNNSEHNSWEHRAKALGLSYVRPECFEPSSAHNRSSEPAFYIERQKWGEYSAAHKMRSAGHGCSYYKIRKVIFTVSGVVSSAFLHLSAHRLVHYEDDKTKKPQFSQQRCAHNSNITNQLFHVLLLLLLPYYDI